MARLVPAGRLRRRCLVVAAAMVLVLAYLLFRRIEACRQFSADFGGTFTVTYTLAFVWLLCHVLLAFAERPHRAAPAAQRRLDAARTVVLVPVYNEDPAWLRKSLASLLAQSRLPDVVSVTDDGSSVCYAAERAWFLAAAHTAGVEAVWQRTPNRGKRHAQITAAREAGRADFYLTVDSDTDLDREALHEILQPFADDRVQAVAGVVMAANAHTNWLTRTVELIVVGWQLQERSAQSVLGSILVNTGAFAAYRAAVVDENVDDYLNETFRGRGVVFSDDSLLTLFAKLRGRTVQQPTALALSAMPETLRHHVRQQVRWTRGAAIRGLWRVRYLPMSDYAFWSQVLNWFTTTITTTVFAWVLLVDPLSASVLLGPTALILTLIGLLRSLRYLTIARADETLRSRLLICACAPAAMLWSITVLRALRWYGLATCTRTGWGTRAGVEVRLRADTPPVSTEPVR